MRKRATLALDEYFPGDWNGQEYPDAAETHPALAALVDFAAQNPGLDARNYISSWDDAHGRAVYRAESRRITRDWQDVCRALVRCKDTGASDADVIEAAARAWGGRYTWDGQAWEYCAGQYWPTEYRAAAAIVIDRAADLARARNASAAK